MSEVNLLTDPFLQGQKDRQERDQIVGRAERYALLCGPNLKDEYRYWACSECRYKIDRHDRFCRYCGARLEP